MNNMKYYRKFKFVVCLARESQQEPRNEKNIDKIKREENAEE